MTSALIGVTFKLQCVEIVHADLHEESNTIFIID